MRNFFTVVFGGLIVVGAALSISYASGLVWRNLPYIRNSITAVPGQMLTALANALPQPSDGTSIFGIKRFIRYTANEEEDLVTNAEQSLPKADGPITASAYIIRDEITGKTVSESNSTRLVPIASLTKLVTAAVARRLIEPSEHIAITSDIINTYGNTAAFRAGEVYRASDLYYPLLMVSSNDAAEALAQSYGRKAFIEAMNNFTQSIGAYRTYFDDASGLSPANESSAADLAVILDWIRKNDPAILDITMTKTKTVGSHTWDNPTHFLNWTNYLGGKNGYIPESNRTGAALFRLGSLHDIYAVVVLGSAYRDGDVVKLLGKVK